MTISINKPCQENWAEMTPDQQGAFCGKCLKTVVDFSTKSLSEIKEFFMATQEQKVCGRFETEQLTNLSFDHFYSRFKRFHFSKRLAIIVCFTFGTWLFESNNAFAQTTKGEVAYIQEKKDTTKKCVKPPPDKNMIMGKVMAPKRTPVDSVKMNQHYLMGEASVENVNQFDKPKKARCKKNK
jgi:hypothetical protein